MSRAFRVTLPDAAATERWAAGLAHLCRAGDCIALTGALGAGKTTFARGFVQALAGPVEVASPTFTLLQTYDIATKNGASTPVCHADLYRLKAASELAELGLEEVLEQGILLVEWPEIAARHLPADRLSLLLETPEGRPETRVLVGNPSSSWYSRLEEAQLLS